MFARHAAAAVLGRPRIAVAAVALVFGVLGLGLRYVTLGPTPHGPFGGPATPPRLAALLDKVFAGPECHGPSETAAQIRQGLTEQGLSGWSVTVRPEVKSTDCVGAASDVERQEVVLNLAMRPEIKRAIAGVTDALLAQCLDRDGAERLLVDALKRAGADPGSYELHTDGSEAGPIERQAEIHAHFEAGCWVYSSSGWRADGVPIYVIGGKS